MGVELNWLFLTVHTVCPWCPAPWSPGLAGSKVDVTPVNAWRSDSLTKSSAGHTDVPQTAVTHMRSQADSINKLIHEREEGLAFRIALAYILTCLFHASLYSLTGGGAARLQ